MIAPPNRLSRSGGGGLEPPRPSASAKTSCAWYPAALRVRSTAWAASSTKSPASPAVGRPGTGASNRVRAVSSSPTAELRPERSAAAAGCGV
jgi:hypothetical protein